MLVSRAFKSAVRFAAKRGQEPSTYAGLAALGAAFGYSLDPGLLQSITMVGVALSGSIAVMVKG